MSYIKEKGINHKKITLLWPQAKSEDEGVDEPSVRVSPQLQKNSQGDHQASSCNTPV